MKKLLFIFLLLPFVAFGQTTYQLNYDSIRVGKTAGTGGTSLYGKTYLKDITAGLASDTLVVTRNGRLYKLPGSAISSIGFLTYILSRDASDISGYEQMPALTSYTMGAADTATVTVSIAETLIQEFATNLGYPNTTLIPSGIFTVHYETQKAAGSNNYYSYAKIYKRSSVGVETLLATTDNSSTVSVNSLQQVTVSALLGTDQTLVTTDRIVVKIYARMSASTASISLYYDNGTDARLEMPSALVDATNFLPYINATKRLKSGFALEGDSIIVTGGTGAQALMANGSVYALQDSLNTKAKLYANYKTAYVDTLGNNTTAVVGRQDKPFATITAAIDALGSSGIVQIGVGRFASPDSSKIKSNFIFQGSGKPVPDWTVSLVGSSVRKTSPTKLINGTVLYGTFDASREKNITVSDLGIDVGSSWATTFNAGAAKDALLFAATDFLNPNPPLPGIVVQNVSTLGKDATSSFHAALFENLYYPVVDNLSTYYLAAGIVIKTTGGTYNGLQAFGHATRGLYVKANDQIVCRDVVISNVEVNDIVNFDNGGAVFTAESGQNIFNVQLTNFSIRNVKGNGLTLSAQSGLALDQLLIANGNIDSVKNNAGNDGNGLFSAARLARSIITGISLRDIDSTGVYLKNLERVTISNINSVVAGSYAFDLSSNDASNASNLYAYQSAPTDRGIRWAGSGMYGTNIINLGTTVGTPLTNLVAAFANLTSNGILKTSGSNGALGTAVAADFPTLNQSTTGNAATVTTNANLTGAVTSTGNTTSLGSFSSANLTSALTDETGTGSAVFATSPTLVTPVLGAATATSLGISNRLNVAGALDNASYPVQVKGNLSAIDANNQNTVFITASPTASYLATSWIGVGGPVPLILQNNGINSLSISTSGIPTFSSLSGTGTRMVVADNTGQLSTQAIPGGGGGSVTGVSVATANGLAGTSDGASVVPTLTLTTTVNSPILAGNGTAISAATTTGSGNTAVLANSPTLVTPVIGAAIGTSVSLTGRGNFGGATDNASYIVQAKGNLSSIDSNNQNTVFLTATPSAAFLSTSFIGGGSYVPLKLQTGGVDALTIATNQAATFSSTISASNFSGSSSGTNTGDQTTITGNAGTATALQTARTISGTSFDGTANITLNNTGITNGAGYITSSALSPYAPLASPALTGSPTAPTQPANDNSTKIATTAYVDALGGTILGAQKQISTTYTNITTSSTSTENLVSTNIPQSALSADGDRVDFSYKGSFGVGAADKFVTLSIGGNTIAVTGNASNKSTWNLEGYLMRTSSTTFRIFIQRDVDFVFTNQIGDYVVTDFNPLSFIVQGQTNDAGQYVRVQMGYIEAKKAP